jgi:hypothetical protein
VALENIASIQEYPCKNRRRGCLELFSSEQIAQHHTVCVYGDIPCPFKSAMNCSWEGLYSDLKAHGLAAHEAWFNEASKTDFIWCAGNNVNITSCFGQLFLQYTRVQYGKLYSAVQLIGTSGEDSKYKCEYTLRAENGIEQISTTLLVRGYSGDFQTIFDSGKCLCLDRAIVSRCLERKVIPYTVTLSKV